ncbi:182 kDa tankyrase-1-binding protein [Indicator indicator]|uniref:182 kDa tankyrase-1-binding protein n=1 Tax=Indicator indicator TaxID=1002788 RepID=UPI0023DFC466|nr:182 kDa tankyrase-1-binding protein [Indicator indicator]
MASQPQPLHPAMPAGTGLVPGSPEKGTSRPKPPVRPKPRVLPKPAVPAKPSMPVPGPRHPCPELPSAEKINRLAGPQPYGGHSAGGPLRRPSFTIKSPETHNGKGLTLPPATATEDLAPAPVEQLPPTPPSSSRKGLASFKVTPVPVATKPERFPGTTVEEILAKMDSREGPGNPDRARLSPFCSNPSPRFGSKTFTAFHRCASGEADGAPSGAPQTPQHVAGEPGTAGNGCLVTETSGSPRAGPSCSGDSRGHWRLPSPPDLSALQPGTFGPPGSPRPPAVLTPDPAPGAPFQPAKISTSAPGSPSAPPELLPPGSPTFAPSSPESPAQPPAPGAPSSTAGPQLGTSRSPGSPHIPGEGSPSPPSTPKLPPRATCPPGSPEAATQYPAPSSPPLAKASCPPGSPEGPGDSLVSFQPREESVSPLQDPGLRRSSEDVLQPPSAGQGLGTLGGSLTALPRPRDLLPEPSLGSESAWSLSQSFEWTFPSWGARLPVSPPQSPIPEVSGSGSPGGQKDAAPSSPCSPGDSGSEGAPCPGGPVAQREAEGSAEEDEGDTEQGGTELHFPLCVAEPDQDPAEPRAQPGLPIAATTLDQASPDPAPTEDSASPWALADTCPVSLQGPGGPCHTEGPPKDHDGQADPGWLTELLASPRAHSLPQDLLGWSRKDLCSEFGIGRAHHPGTFDWGQEAAARERDWPGETDQDQEFGTKTSWDSPGSSRDRDQLARPFSSARNGWHSGYGTELAGEARLGCSHWPPSHGVGQSCPRDPDLSSGKAEWGTGYGLGSREEIGASHVDWGSSHSMGHRQQQDRQPSWAGSYHPRCPQSQDRDTTTAWPAEYGTGGTEMKDKEQTPDWASKYSSRDAKGKDLTLGWAGRSSTGDTGSLEQELSPSRTGWDRQYSSRDMESQDQEFSPNRPAQASTHGARDTETWDRDFNPSRSTWGDGCSTRDVETQDKDVGSQDQELSPRQAAWIGEPSTRDMESLHQEFSPSQPAWDDKYNTRDMETQDRDLETWDRELKPSRAAWDDEHSTRHVENQDQKFSPSRPAEASKCPSWGSRFSPSKSPWGDRCSTRDMEAQERDMETQDHEFSPSRLAEASEHSTRDMESRDGESKPSSLVWSDKCGIREMESQDQESKRSRSALDGQYSTTNVETWDTEIRPGQLAWDSEGSSREMESQDREFSPSRPAWSDRCGTGVMESQDRDMESQDQEFSPNRPAKASEHSTEDMETWDREFGPSRSHLGDRCSTRDLDSQNRDMETWDSRFRPSRSSWDDRCSSRDVETWDREFSPSRSALGDGCSTRDMESQDREFSPSRLPHASRPSSVVTEEGEAEPGPSQLSWAGGGGVSQAELGQAFGARRDSLGSHVLDPMVQEPSWDSACGQEHDATKSRDWAEELGEVQCHNQFGAMMEQVLGSSGGGSMAWSGGMGSGGRQEPLEDWHGDLSFGTSQDLSFSSPLGTSEVRPGQASGEGLGSDARLEKLGWSMELQDAEAKRQEWANAFSARCAARSQELSCGEQSPGAATSTGHRTILLLDPSPPRDDALIALQATKPPQSEPPSPTEEQRDPPEPPLSTRASPPGLGAASGAQLDTESEGPPLDHPDGERAPSQGEKRLSMSTSQPETPLELPGQFTFLEDTEVLDSSMYRSKASLGRKRPHRAPALRPAASAEGDAWIFRDSTEPRAPHPAASDEDEEVPEEPKSRRVRPSPGKGVKVPLFPGLSTAALKAKLRGRNRSAEEGAVPGDSKGPPAKDPHVQRSKSCKLPGLSGKPPALPPKPEKSSGSEASPPHWLQALKLKKKKP